MEAYPAEVI